MKTKDAFKRRALLKPLIRRKTSPSQIKRMEKALADFDEWSTASYASIQLLENRPDRGRLKTLWLDPKEVKSQILVFYSLYLARQLALPEYILRASLLVERIHDSRLIDTTYPEIKRLTKQIRQVQKHHGLKPDEYWPVGKGPQEYQDLNRLWNDAADKRFLECLQELEGNIAADLYVRDRKQFDLLRERGRRALFHADAIIDILVDTINRYEHEARLAAQQKAYTASVTLLGAATEGLLLLRCLRSRDKAMEISQQLDAKYRPKREMMRWSFDQLIHVCQQCGWLPKIQAGAIIILPDKLADHIKNMRNLIHPGRVSKDKPWIEVELRDYEDAEIIYSTLYSSVFNKTSLNRLGKLIKDQFVM